VGITINSYSLGKGRDIIKSYRLCKVGIQSSYTLCKVGIIIIAAIGNLLKFLLCAGCSKWELLYSALILAKGEILSGGLDCAKCKLKESIACEK
jgi:hypothetical protein